MGRSENPLHPAFWLGASDPRPLALFRIGFGLALLQDVLCSYLPNLFAFLADGGIVPRATLTDPALWSVFRLVGSDAGVAVLFTLGLLVLLAFTLGFHTRVATVLTFVFITSLLLHFPALCKLMTKLVLALEWAFAFLAFSPVRIATCRALAIAAAIAVQGGILTTLRVGVFTGVCLWMNTLFLQPEWLDRAEAWWGARRGSSWPFTGAPRPVPIERGQLAGAPALRLVTFAFLATLFIGEAWGPFIGSKVREPQVLVTERRYLQVSQAYDLFGSTYDLLRWRAPGERADGTPVDALTLTAPRTQDPVGWFFSPWTKFTFNSAARRARACRRWARGCAGWPPSAGRRWRGSA